jgi:hypothetical protein
LYADLHGSREILELRYAGLTIRQGDQDLRPAIAAVRARLEDGTLKVLSGATPNLIAETGLYRYDPESRKRSENPIKEFDHALDALRYLISKIDFRRMAKIRKSSSFLHPSSLILLLLPLRILRPSTLLPLLILPNANGSAFGTKLCGPPSPSIEPMTKLPLNLSLADVEAIEL